MNKPRIYLAGKVSLDTGYEWRSEIVPDMHKVSEGFDPTFTIGQQISENVRVHERVSRAAARLPLASVRLEGSPVRVLGIRVKGVGRDNH